jgi:hypothetical protein
VLAIVPFSTSKSLQALAVPQFITVLVAAIDASFGTSYSLYSSGDVATVARVCLLDPPQAHTKTNHQDQSIRASDILFLLALCVSKFSVVWFCRRLFAVGQQKMNTVCIAIMALCGLWCLGSILGVTVGCSASGYVHANEQTCSNLVSSRKTLPESRCADHFA